MITEKDLREAIAECQGERNPNANTCIKLAAYYTIMEHLFPGEREETPSGGYSFSQAPEPAGTPIDYDSGTEFSEAIHGRDPAELWPILDEIMETLRVVNPRLYGNAMRMF